MSAKKKNLFWAGVVIAIGCLGCAPLEITRLFGVGVKPFKRAGKVISKTVDEDRVLVYGLVQKTLKKMNATVYRGSQKERFLVAIHFHHSFRRCSDTTEVAIFFTVQGQKKTELKVASLNYPLAEFVFSRLLDVFAENDVL